MRDETLYHEYSDWKLTNQDLIDKLKAMDSPLILRLEHVLAVVDYFYDKLIDDPEYTDEDHAIFETGFYYLYDQVEELSNVLKEYYNNDYLALNLDAKKVNLLLNTIDFQNELLNFENFNEKDMAYLLEFEHMVKEKLQTKEPISDDVYLKFDEESELIFKRIKGDGKLIQTIYMEIASELDLI